MNQSFRVWHFSPYSVEKNFGEAINDYCALVPAGDWICLRDGDAMMLLPDWGKQIHDIAERAEKDGYSLIGATTNRLRQTYQLASGMFNNHNMKDQYKVALSLREKNYSEITRIKAPVAGFFMLFPKSTWEKYKFQEKTECFDTVFSNVILINGGKIGIAIGLYLYHAYRLWSDNPRSDIKHLLKTS